jgi:hypothetical protein
MAAGTWFLIIGIALLVIISIFSIIYYSQPQPIQKKNEYYEILNNRSQWSNPAPGPNLNKNKCQIYTFPVAKIDNTYFLPSPTYNTLLLNESDGKTIPASLDNYCIDSDQILAQQIETKCVGPREDSRYHDLISLCTRQNGDTAKVGETEIYYANNLIGTGHCPTIKECAGRLSLISLSHNENYPTNLICVQKNKKDDVIAETCNPSKQNQLFRITRTDIGQNPQDLVAGRVFCPRSMIAMIIRVCCQVR